MKKSKKLKKYYSFQRGIALLLTVTILAIVMLIAVSIAAVIATQLRLSSDINSSVIAIYAADSGIEWVLYNVSQGVSVNPPIMSNGAGLNVTETSTPGHLTVKSLGSYGSVKREFQFGF